MQSRWIPALLASLVATTPCLSFAETPAATEPSAESTPPEAAVDSEAANQDAEATEAPEAPVEEAPLVGADGSFPRIADDQETIFAVQRKAYLVSQKLEISPMFTAVINNRFTTTLAPMLSVGYHVGESFALQAFGSYMFASESDVTTEILTRGQLAPEDAELVQMRWAAGLTAEWSPVYGKMQVLGSELGTFSFYLAGGLALGQTRVQCRNGEELDPNVFPGQTCAINQDAKTVYRPLELRPMGVLGAGLRFYFSNWLGVKLEVRDYIFTTRVYRPGSKTLSDAVTNSLFAQIGVSFLLGGEDN